MKADYFAGAREAIRQRREALCVKYPDVAERIPYAVREQARDACHLARTGQIDESAPEWREAIDECRDILLLAWWDAVEANEVGAAQRMHAALADAMTEDRTTPTMRVVSAAMHNAISRGAAVDVATMTALPAGAPSKRERDDAIRRYVASQRTLEQMFGRKTKVGVIHKAASEIFGVSIKTVRNLCATPVE